MKISSYSFGRITVNGETYTQDLIIFPAHIRSSWWRQQGHSLSPDDLKEVTEAAPDLLIVGTGYSGAMKVPADTISYLESRGIEVEVRETTAAVTAFNGAPESRKVVAALHLTC